jgi:hypothetical protein
MVKAYGADPAAHLQRLGSHSQAGLVWFASHALV